MSGQLQLFRISYFNLFIKMPWRSWSKQSCAQNWYKKPKALQPRLIHYGRETNPGTPGQIFVSFLTESQLDVGIVVTCCYFNARYAHWEEAAVRLPAAITTEAALRDRVEQLSQQEQQVYAQAGQIHDLNKGMFHVLTWAWSRYNGITNKICWCWCFWHSMWQNFGKRQCFYFEYQFPANPRDLHWFFYVTLW